MIFLSQITDPDYENTRELCIENKYDITECIDRIRSKERRLGRGNPREKVKSLSIRRNMNIEDENQERIDIKKYKNERGYYSIPSDIWSNLTPDDQETVRWYNGSLRNSRKELGNHKSPDEKSIMQRRTSGKITNDDKEDRNPSPPKKMRMVQFRESDSDPSEDENMNQDDSNKNDTAISDSRGILAFNVRDKN